MTHRPGPVVIDLPAEPAAPGCARELLRSLAERSPDVRLRSEELDEVCVAVQEACSNAVRHGCGERPDARFRVEIHRRTDALEVRVCDPGPGFSLGPCILPSPEALQEGGYGTFIMLSWMHEVTLERRGDENVLVLVRRYGVPLATATEPADA